MSIFKEIYIQLCICSGCSERVLLSTVGLYTVTQYDRLIMMSSAFLSDRL